MAASTFSSSGRPAPRARTGSIGSASDRARAGIAASLADAGAGARGAGAHSKEILEESFILRHLLVALRYCIVMQSARFARTERWQMNKLKRNDMPEPGSPQRRAALISIDGLGDTARAPAVEVTRLVKTYPGGVE